MSQTLCFPYSSKKRTTMTKKKKHIACLGVAHEKENKAGEGTLRMRHYVGAILYTVMGRELSTKVLFE